MRREPHRLLPPTLSFSEAGSERRFLRLRGLPTRSSPECDTWHQEASNGTPEGQIRALQWLKGKQHSPLILRALPRPAVSTRDAAKIAQKDFFPLQLPTAQFRCCGVPQHALDHPYECLCVLPKSLESSRNIQCATPEIQVPTDYPTPTLYPISKAQSRTDFSFLKRCSAFLL